MHTNSVVIGTVVSAQETETKGQNPKPLLTVVVETDANDRGYKDLVAIETTKPEKFPSVSKGQKVAVRYSAKSREYQGKFYTNLGLLELQVLGASAAQATKRHDPRDDDYGPPPSDGALPF